MPLTKTDIQNINAFLKEGSVEAARRILLNSDDERATVMLAKIDAKYPTKAVPPAAIVAPKSATKTAAKPVTIDPLDAARGLMAQGKLDDAEALLWTLDDNPGAEDLLKVIKRMQETGVKSAADVGGQAKTKEKSAKRPDYLVWGVCIAIIAAVIIVPFGIPAIQRYINRVELKMEDICRSKFFDGYLDKEYTFDQLDTGCHYAALEVMDIDNSEANYCFNAFGETDKRLEDCLTEQEVYFYQPFIYQARDNPEMLGVPGNFPTPDFSR